VKLNLCCGTNLFPGWLNIDQSDVEQDYLRHLRDAPEGFVWPPEQQRLADAVKAGQLDFRRHDVRHGLPFPDGSVEAIYVGQAIEHFNRRTEAPRFLKECCRVLRQYGVIKLTTPDLGKLALAYYDSTERGGGGLGEFTGEQPAFYASAEPADQLAYLLFGASGENSTNENYEGHHHCYTSRSLGTLLEECGFQVRFTDNVEFRDCIDKGMSHSFAIEAVKALG